MYLRLWNSHGHFECIRAPKVAFGDNGLPARPFVASVFTTKCSLKPQSHLFQKHDKKMHFKLFKFYGDSELSRSGMVQSKKSSVHLRTCNVPEDVKDGGEFCEFLKKDFANYEPRFQSSILVTHHIHSAYSFSNIRGRNCKGSFAELFICFLPFNSAFFIWWTFISKVCASQKFL